MGRTCAFVDCTNSTYKLERWKKSFCDKHNCMHMDSICSCPPPFKLFKFPQDPEVKKEWTKLIFRKDFTSGKNWTPNVNSRVCSDHFSHGEPTTERPLPDQNLPTSVKEPKARKRPAERQEPTRPVKKPAITDNEKARQASVDFHGGYCKVHECEDCNEKNLAMKEVLNKFVDLDDDSVHKSSPPAYTKEKVDKTLKFLKTNRKVRTFTGLRSRQAFEDLLSLVSKKAANMRYWRGNRRFSSVRLYKQTPRKSGPARKLTMREELVLVLVKIKQNLSNDMLAVLFGVSATVISCIFTTWIKLLSQELKPLIYWPSKERVFRNFPKSLPQKGDYRHLRATIDCTEIFIERPRDLRLQALTWSDYKHHNTVKLFVAIAPNGMISFLPPAWGGRASDQYVTRHCGFLELLEQMDVILADRGFPIQEDLLLRQAQLIIPPPGSGLDQMSRDKVKKTGQVANARIHVERAIGQMKYFEILNSTFPITMVPLIDDIATVCAALSNLRPSLVA